MKKSSSFLGFGLCFVLASMTMSCGFFIPTSNSPQKVQSDKTTLNMDCKNICGPGFVYDRPGGKLGGREKVCTWYPYDCGYGCTKGWDFEYLKDGTDYTCQTARQVPPKPVNEDLAVNDAEIKAMNDMDCKNICGPGFVYDRPGAKLEGREKVCTWYPYDCGYGCTKGWDFEYLKDGTDYTCQTARQVPPKPVNEDPEPQWNEAEIKAMNDMDCKNICGPGFVYDRPGALLDGREKVCTWYPYDCGYGCTTGWDIEQLKDGTDYTCQTAKQNP